ncbi:MAG TPA: UDP-N-acetylmuramate--L-alanine ligase, partial [Chlamydiales bacterium]|nr:UDP-N-acetylmuramate--L-alanine ligase [Chlamydiales bacterium]
LHRSDLLLQLMTSHEVLAISGTHGKTTTTSLMIHLFKEAGWDPAFAVGGMMKGIEMNSSDGKGQYFVAEADESDGTFLKYNYHSAIITNIDTDHLAHYGTWDNLVASFSQFAKKAKTANRLFYCIDCPTLEKLKPQGISYGFSEKAELQGSHFRQDGFSVTFDASFQGKCYRDITVALTGYHNAQNALAVFGLALSLGLSEEKIRHGFANFSGVKRRMDKKGQVTSISVFDDYAHHPTEIRATLSALRAAVKEKRIIAVYQPHRYSRMKYVMDELDGIFEQADCVVVTDLYSANEAPVAGVSTEQVIKNLQKSHVIPVLYIPRAQLVHQLHELLRPHDVVITMGAGDITKVGGELVAELQKRAPKKFRVGILFGGMNCEHEVSCNSAKTFVKHLDPDLYDVHCFQIGLNGCFQKASNELQPTSCNDSIITPELFSELLL